MRSQISLIPLERLFAMTRGFAKIMLILGGKRQVGKRVVKTSGGRLSGRRHSLRKYIRRARGVGSDTLGNIAIFVVAHTRRFW